MCSCIRTSRLLLILAVITVSLVLPPHPGVSTAGSGDDSPHFGDGDGRTYESGDSDGSEPDEFGIYVTGEGRQGKAAGVPEFYPEGELKKNELSGFWIAVLRVIWMIRH